MFNAFCDCLQMARVDCKLITNHHPYCEHYQKELEEKILKYVSGLIEIIEQNKTNISLDENSEQILKKSKFLIGNLEEVFLK